MNIFLIKSEPSTYSLDDLRREGTTAWTGIRNFQARNHLRSMKRGDQCLFYHSGEGRAVVGLAEVVKTAYPDPTAKEGDWSAVDVKFLKSFAHPITLAEVKEHPKLKTMQLVTHSRLSVQVVTAQQLKDLLSILM